MRTSKTKFDEGVKERLRGLFDDQSTYHSRDVDDLDSARAALSGFGFDEKDKAMWGEMKPEVTIPVLDNWINQTIVGYTSNPFGLGLKAMSQNKDISYLRMVFDHVQESNALTDLVAKEFQTVLGPGYSYLLVGSEVVDTELNLQDVVIKSLDPRKVICGYSDDPELDDCQILAYYEVMSKEQAMSKFGLEYSDIRGSGRDVLSGFDVVEDSRTQCSVVSVYERVPEGVVISKIVHNTVVAQTTVPLSRIPVVRLYADDCWIEKVCHFRGVYQKVIDLWKFANYNMSLAQFRVANAETANWVVDPKSIAQNPDEWESGSDSSVKSASTYDGTSELRPPTQVSKETGVAELMQAAQMTQAQIKDLLGNPIGEGKQSQTAEEVLARKATSEASVSKYLANLKRALKSLGQSILDYIAICYDVPRFIGDQQIPAVDTSSVTVTIDGGPLVASQRQRVMQQLMLINEMATKAGVPGFAAKIIPVLLQNADLPEKEKQILMMAVAPQGPQIPPEVQQAMQQKDMQIQQVQQAMAESQKNVAALQQALFEMQQDSKASLLKTQMEIESRERIEMMKLQGQGVALDKELMAESKLQTQKLMLEYQKAMTKANIEAAKIETPLFTSSKFTG